MATSRPSTPISSRWTIGRWPNSAMNPSGSILAGDMWKLIPTPFSVARSRAAFHNGSEHVVWPTTDRPGADAVVGHGLEVGELALQVSDRLRRSSGGRRPARAAGPTPSCRPGRGCRPRRGRRPPRRGSGSCPPPGTSSCPTCSISTAASCADSRSSAACTPSTAGTARRTRSPRTACRRGRSRGSAARR